MSMASSVARQTVGPCKVSVAEFTDIWTRPSICGTSVQACTAIDNAIRDLSCLWSKNGESALVSVPKKKTYDQVLCFAVAFVAMRTNIFSYGLPRRHGVHMLEVWGKNSERSGFEAWGDVEV